MSRLTACLPSLSSYQPTYLPQSLRCCLHIHSPLSGCNVSFLLFSSDCFLSPFSFHITPSASSSWFCRRHSSSQYDSWRRSLPCLPAFNQSLILGDENLFRLSSPKRQLSFQCQHQCRRLQASSTWMWFRNPLSSSSCRFHRRDTSNQSASTRVELLRVLACVDVKLFSQLLRCWVNERINYEGINYEGINDEGINEGENQRFLHPNLSEKQSLQHLKSEQVFFPPPLFCHLFLIFLRRSSLNIIRHYWNHIQWRVKDNNPRRRNRKGKWSALSRLREWRGMLPKNNGETNLMPSYPIWPLMSHLWHRQPRGWIRLQSYAWPLVSFDSSTLLFDQLPTTGLRRTLLIEDFQLLPPTHQQLPLSIIHHRRLPFGRHLNSYDQTMSGPSWMGLKGFWLLLTVISSWFMSHKHAKSF